jgi:hypothetical protein
VVMRLHYWASRVIPYRVIRFAGMVGALPALLPDV